MVSPSDKEGAPGFAERLAAAARRILGAPGAVHGLKRLSGGANMETWAFDWIDAAQAGGAAPRPLILRRAPAAALETPDHLASGVASLSLDAQAALLAAAARGGVKVPATPGALCAEDGLGAGFLMERVPGEALPGKILPDPAYADALAGLTRECATELVKIHRLPIENCGAELALKGVEGALQELTLLAERLAPEIPAFGLALGWLERHRPPETDPALLHGDFRMGNLLITPEGLSSVLDWELAHLGDPAQDLAFLCAPAWRFGLRDRPVGGFGQIDDLLTAYESAGGRHVPRERFRYWLVFACLQWGLICLIMMELWRSGRDRSLERAVVGTRVSESELEALLLLEGDAGAAESIDWPESIHWPENGEPSASGGATPPELAEALIRWASEDLLPRLEGRALFEARVARKTLGVLRRQAAFGPAVEAARRDGVRGFGLTLRELTETLRADPAALSRAGLLGFLRRDVAARLLIEQPKYAGLAAARAKWSRP